MLEELIIKVKDRKFQTHSQVFSFFHSNAIKKILTSKKIDQVILYRDLQCLDDQTQYLKRTYQQTQAFGRLKKLINYYQSNMTPPSPNLLPLDQYQYLQNRNRKLLKLCILKQKSQAQMKKSFINLKASIQRTVGVLDRLDDTGISRDTDKEDDQEISYDTHVHDVFQLYEQQHHSNQLITNVLSVRDIRQSHFIIDFKISKQSGDDQRTNNNHHINVLSPPPQVLKFKQKQSIHIKSSINMINSSNQAQRIIPNITQVQQKPLQKQQQIDPQQIINQQVNGKVIIPTSALAITLSSGRIQTSSKQNKQRIISYRMQQGIKSPNKPTSFMDYYHSIPVKNPTNILQKYIKRKR